MTTDLREGLTELAERQPTASPPPDLWRRGVRRRRRGRALTAGVTVAAACLGVLLVTSGLDVVRQGGPGPSDAVAEPAIPDRVWTPDPRLDGTEGDPVGPLALVAGAERSVAWWGGSRNGTVGVAAETGEYCFLDLPDQVEWSPEDPFDADDVALSPDGRQVAYWVAHPDNPGWVGGYAVYDTVTGDVVRRKVRNDLGLGPETLAWAGNEAVVVQYGVVEKRTTDSWSSRTAPPLLWRPNTDEQVALRRWGADVITVSPTEQGFAILTPRGLELRQGLQAKPTQVLPVTGRRNANEGSVSPDAGTMVVLSLEESGRSLRPLVGSLRSGERLRLAPLPVDIEMYGLLGWRDATNVVVRAAVPGTDGSQAGAYAIDIRTGEHELLVKEDRVSWGNAPAYASDLWSRPTVERPAPDDVTDPRLVAGGAAALLFGGFWVLRRRRARR